MSTLIKYALVKDNAFEPFVKHDGDAGIDVYAVEDYVVHGFSEQVVSTGVAFNIPEGYVMQAWPKSRSNFLVGAGIIDHTYQGEVLIKIVNYHGNDLVIRAGDPVAQLVIVANIAPKLEESIPSMLFETTSERGATGGIVEQTGSWKDPYIGKDKFGQWWD